jgi:hypothetical protein
LSYSLHHDDELQIPFGENNPSPPPESVPCDTTHVLTESSEESSDDEMDSSNDSMEDENSTSVDSTDTMSWSFTYDKTLYSSGVAVTILPNSDLTLLQWLAMNFHLFTSHPALSKQSFTESLQLQKRLQIDTEDIIPSSYYQARKLIQPYLVPKNKYDVCINDCIVFRDSSKFKCANLLQCPVCEHDRYVSGSKGVAQRTFIYIPIGPRLARFYGETNLAKIVQSHPGDTYDETEMFDIHHSPGWKALYSPNGYFRGDKMGISLALELDGVNPFHNIGVQYSMTPMMLTLLNLPRHIRNSFGNISLVGIIPGRREKSEATAQDAFVEILVDELLCLTECQAYSEYHKGPVDVKIKLLLYVLDYPGLSKLFNQHGSGSLAGCHWCCIRGMKCKHLDKVVYLSNRSYLPKDDQMRKDNSHFVPKLSDDSDQPKSRTMADEESYRRAFENARNKTQAGIIATATGCKGTYTLARLPGHNRIEESKPDACHTLKDVTQNIMNLITSRKTNVEKIVLSEEHNGRLHIINNSERNAEMDVPVPRKKRKSNDSSAKKVFPFILTQEELRIADERAKSIRPPLGFGLKPSPFFSKPGSLKSHDYKQIASQGIFKYCIRDVLSDTCRQTLFRLFDSISDLCKESHDLDGINELEAKLNAALACLERDFPLSLQNVTTHLLHHIPEGIKLYGPVYGTWMFVFERFNSWLCKRTLNMRYPEATAVETFLIYDWCQFMVATNRIPSYLAIDMCHSINFDSTDELGELRESCKDSGLEKTAARSRSAGTVFVPEKKELKSIHKLCDDEMCDTQKCVLSKYYVHQEEHPVTKRLVTYTCVYKERKSAKTVSSYVCSEHERGKQQSKVIGGRFVLFGQIQYFVAHKTSKLAYVKWLNDLVFDGQACLWKAKSDGANDSCSFICVKNLSLPLVTAVENDWIWFCNSGILPFICN